MKTFISSCFALLLALLASSCHHVEDIIHPHPPGNKHPSFHTDKTNIVTSFLANQQGDPPTDSAELLFENRKMNPLTAPDGHQLNYGQFSAAHGTLTMNCVPGGTKVTVRMKNLIPYGLYTFWVAILNASGDVVALGASGGSDGQYSFAVADSDGSVTYSQVVPEGPLSVRGKADECLLDEHEVHIVGAYHLDGRTYGGELGPAGTVAQQFFFAYQQ